VGSYLYGNKFEVCTDNNPLTYVLGKAKLDATSQRWIAALAIIKTLKHQYALSRRATRRHLYSIAYSLNSITEQFLTILIKPGQTAN
jgi:hypothetical protein